MSPIDTLPDEIAVGDAYFDPRPPGPRRYLKVIWTRQGTQWTGRLVDPAQEIPPEEL